MGLNMQYAKGQRVVIKPSSIEVQDLFPVANWIKKAIAVTLLESCLKGSIDQVKVKLNDGTQRLIYGYNVDRLA